VGPVYEEVNVKVKPSAKPRALKAAKAGNPGMCMIELQISGNFFKLVLVLEAAIGRW